MIRVMGFGPRGIDCGSIAQLYPRLIHPPFEYFQHRFLL